MDTPLLLNGPDLARRRLLLAVGSATAAAAALSACDRAPEGVQPFNYTLLNGQTLASSALQGQVVLVNFWATTCGICVREMPRFVALHRQFGARGLQTLAVAVQHDPPALVSQYAERKALPFGVAIDNTGAIAKAFGGVRGTPTTVLLGREGQVLWRVEGEPDFDALHGKLQALLGAPGPVTA